MAPSHSRLVLIAAVALLAVASSAIFIRLALEAAQTQSPGFSLVVASMRMGIAALLLLPAWRSLRTTSLQPGAWPLALAAGVALALHFATWITSLSYTSIAASTTLVNTSPIWVALLSWGLFREVPSRLTALGIGLALAGGAVIGLSGGTSEGSGQGWLGNGLAVLGALAVSGYYLLGREAQRRGFGLGLYVAVAYGAAALTLLPLPWLLGSSYQGYPAATYFWIALMALLPQLVGHTSVNYLVRWWPATLVSVLLLFEPLGASLLGYLVFGEVPTPQVLLGAAIILAGTLVTVRGTRI